MTDRTIPPERVLQPEHLIKVQRVFTSEQVQALADVFGPYLVAGKFAARPVLTSEIG